MSKVTVTQLADVLGVDSKRLLAQLNDAGIKASSGDDAVSNEDKKKLLAHLRASHGKLESDATAPRRVTLKRKTVSELRVPGSGPRASARTVNVEVRKRRTYVKREVVQPAGGGRKGPPEEGRGSQAGLHGNGPEGSRGASPPRGRGAGTTGRSPPPR
jgi:translation initiation factor IF-2